MTDRSMSLVHHYASKQLADDLINRAQVEAAKQSDSEPGLETCTMRVKADRKGYADQSTVMVSQ